MTERSRTLLEALKSAIVACDLLEVEKAAAVLLESLEAAAPKEPGEIADRLERAATAGDRDTIRRLVEECAAKMRSNPVAYPKTFVALLEQAVESFEQERVVELCRALTAHLRVAPEVYPFAEAKKILDLLRRKRHFGPMMRVADVLLQTGQDSARIRRQYCQALLDTGQLAAGLEMLSALERDCDQSGDEDELAEARGLIGRALKQMYIDAAQFGTPTPALRAHLVEAIDAYDGVYEREKSKIWHGINVVACVKRAEVDQIDLGARDIDADRIAEDLHDAIAAKGRRESEGKGPDLWEMATAAEARVAVGDFATALDWIVRYTGESGADAFEIASTLRQFEQVWRLEPSKPEQAKILQLLRAALLSRQGGSVRIDDPRMEAVAAAGLANDPEFEAVLGEDRYRTYQWYKTGLDSTSAVAQIRDPSGTGHGTGFLVRGADLHDSITEKWVLVTNAHVISDDPDEQAGAPAALPPDEAVVVFEAGPGEGSPFEVERLLFTSPRRDLDCSVVTLRGEVHLDKPLQFAKRLPRLTGGKQRVYVLGHPRGGGLSFSIDDNLLLDHDAPKVHYRAPTEGGSSGSPVFNQAWQLIALHHAGGERMRRLHDQPGTYAANEGLALASIREAVSRRLG